MAGPGGNPPAQLGGPPYMHPFRPASSMSANRFDEGYSEDTPSHSEGDMPMAVGGQSDAFQGLPDWVLALSEAERSGGSLLRDIKHIC
jgi:F-box and WD-40 domain protein 1/11